MRVKVTPAICLLLLFVSVGRSPLFAQTPAASSQQAYRQQTAIGDGWKFYRYGPNEKPDSLIYDVRPEMGNERDDKAADSRPTERANVTKGGNVLKPWILPTGNKFINDSSRRHRRPDGHPGGDFPFTQSGFNDGSWETVNIPHDWAIKGPFYTEAAAIIGGGMGRLPVHGVAWYRKKIDLALSEKRERLILEIDGAMSYAMVWINGKLAGGWPYGYNSWQLDITPYVVAGANQIAIRLDNPPASARWYPGGGIYRNIWLIKTAAVHIGQWGTAVTTDKVSKTAATINLKAEIENEGATAGDVTVSTAVFLLDEKGRKTGQAVGATKPVKTSLAAQSKATVLSSLILSNPKLWGPPPTQKAARYVAVTEVLFEGRLMDRYETPFGIRAVRFDADKGLLVNGEKIIIKGANQHHDLGALGAAFNLRAAERQLEILREMGCNAIRLSHNPPAPELLELTDRMGFLVIDEVFDCWELKKTPLDFHLIFPDWHEQDLRAMIRRDKNHPSVIMWSFGNEVGEQYTDAKGAAVAKELYGIVKEEDPTRPATVAMNYAKANMPLPEAVDIVSLNYQGEGIRNEGAYAGLKGITTPPQFPSFHQKFPGKLIQSSENASALSSRGEFLFPVFAGSSAPVRDSLGGDSETHQVTAYELHSADFGSSADKVFATLDKHPYVAGGFVWSGWDYLGEPTPYYSSRSSYCGVIDLAGFKKERFYLYQSYWRPDFPMAHILPHWNWPARIGQITPVHVFTSGDEAELFLNGKSLGRKKKEAYQYRLRWDDVAYTPGTLKAVAYKGGKPWAEDVVQTTGAAASIRLSADRQTIEADGKDLSFITVRVTDEKGLTVPDAKNNLQFSVEGPGEIAATDNGDAADLVSFASTARPAFNGLCLAIVRGKRGVAGTLKVKARSTGLKEAVIEIRTR